MIKYKILKEIIEKPISGEWGNEGGKVKVLRTTNFTNHGKLDLSKVTTREIEQKKVDSKKLIIGDIIIEKSGGSPTQPVGRVVFFEEKGVYLCNNFTAILRPKQDEVFPKYLNYILFCNHLYGYTNSYQNKTTGIINLQLPKYIEASKIPLPPLETQKKIATILDAADAYRQKTKALIAKYDELTQSLFLDMFGDPVRNEKGWELDSLTNFGELKNGLNFSNSEKGEKIGYLGVGDFKSLYKITDVRNLKKIELTKTPSKDFILKNGDIVFVRSNGNRQLIGRCLAIYPDKNSVTFSGFCIRYRISNFKLTSDFLIHLFRVKSFKEVMLEGGRGANIQNINQKLLNDLSIPVPPISLQNQFAERIQQIEVQKAQAQASLEKSEELFNSLLQRAFSGEMM